MVPIHPARVYHGELMIAKWLCVFCALTTAVRAADDAAALLDKAVEAFRKNEPKQKNWNWQNIETRELVDRSGSAVQKFPAVTSESVIRGDGRRCNAVLTWGDGKKPYLAEADPTHDARRWRPSGRRFHRSACW